MEYLNFGNIYGSNEDAYSKIMAQTFIISEKFRSKFIALINSKHSDDKIKCLSAEDLSSVSLEKSFYNLGRLDISFELQSGMNIGIENKKWAGLQPNQLERYKEAFENIGQPYILVFLSPRNYALGANDKPKNLIKGVFVEVNYSEIYLICQQIVSEAHNELEKRYFSCLINFLGGVTLKPLTSLEIESLKSYFEAKNKIVNILREAKNDKEIIEDTANYLLSSRNIKDNICYFGFRFGTQWYYDQPLSKNSAEMIFYVKDTETNSENANKKNLLLERLCSAHKSEIIKIFDCQVDYYVRKRDNECRFAIRKSLLDFENKDIGEPINWLLDVLQYMTQKL